MAKIYVFSAFYYVFYLRSSNVVTSDLTEIILYIPNNEFSSKQGWNKWNITRNSQMACILKKYGQGVKVSLCSKEHLFANNVPVIESRVLRRIFASLSPESFRSRLCLEGYRCQAYCLETLNTPNIWLNRVFESQPLSCLLYL